MHECFERAEHQTVFGDSLQRKKTINSWLHVVRFRLFFVIRAEYLRETKYFLIFLMSKNLLWQGNSGTSPDLQTAWEQLNHPVPLSSCLVCIMKKSPPFLLSLYTYAYTNWYFGEGFRKSKRQDLHKRCQIMIAEITVISAWN